MNDQVMEVLAYLALAIGIGLLVFHLAFPHLPRQLKVVRFRRRMRRRLDSVVTTWKVEMTAKTDPSEDLARRPRRPNHPESA